MANMTFIPAAFRRPRSFGQILLWTSWLAIISALPAGDNPSFSLEETIVEYDVDPSWPKRPDLGHARPGRRRPGSLQQAHRHCRHPGRRHLRDRWLRQPPRGPLRQERQVRQGLG